MNAFSLAAAGIMLACIVPATAQPTQSELRAAASALVDRFMAAWSQSDAQALAALFAADADFINPWGTKAVGRDEIAAFYAGAFKSGFAGSKGTGDLVSVRAIAPDLMLIDARWRIAGAKMPDGAPRADEQGILVALVGRTANGWQILALRENASATEITALAASR